MLFILFVVIFDLLMLASCNASWITEAQSIITVLGGSALNVIAIVAALKGSTIAPAAVTEAEAIFAKITAGLSTIGTLISSYNSTNSLSVLADINAGLADVKTNLGLVLKTLNVTDPETVAKITELLGLFTTEIDSLAELIPIVTKTANIALLKAAVAKSKLLDAKEFKTAWRAAILKPTGSPIVDAAVKKAVA
jgi:hypothetical protein